MKKIIISIIFATCCIFSIAQIDRTKAPKGGEIPKINFGKIESFKLKNGLTVILVENHKLPKVRVDVYFDYPPVAGDDKIGIENIFGAMMRAGTKNYTKDEIDENSEFLGTNLFIGARLAGIDALKRNLNPSLEILSDIIINPTFNNEKEFENQVKQSLSALDVSDKHTDAIMNRVHNAVLYGKKHPYGKFETKETLNNIKQTDLRNFYNININPKVSYLTFVGDITLKEAKKLSKKYFSKWKKKPVSPAVLPITPSVNQKRIVLIDLPTSTQANIFVSHLMDYKKSDANYHATRLGNIILGGGSFSRLFKNIREDKGYTYGAYSRVKTDRYIGQFTASAKVRNEIVDSAIVEFIKEINKINSTLPTVEELNVFKTETTGKFALSLEQPEIIAQYARNELIEKLGEGFYANFLKNMNSVTREGVLEAMQEELKPSQTIIFVVGKATELLPHLKKLDYPIEFFDKWANKTSDPTIVKKIDKGIKAIDIINKYLEAIGGKDILMEKKTMIKKYDITMAESPVAMKTVLKVTQKNQFVKEFYYFMPGSDPSSPGTLASRVVFDGKTGYSIGMGKKVPMKEDEILKRQTILKGIFPKLNYAEKLADNMILEGIVPHKDHEVYKIKCTHNGDEFYEFYNTETYLLEEKKSEETAIVNGKEEKSIATSSYSDYKTFDGVKIPTTVIESFGPYTQTYNLTSVSFNDKIDDEEFK